MRKLDTSPITSVSGFPVKSGTLDHIQAAYAETTDYLAQALVATVGDSVAYDPSIPYFLNNFAVITNAFLTYTVWSQGLIYWQGEIFFTPGGNVIAPGATAYSGQIVTNFLTAPTADPVTFTDTSTHNVHQIRTMTVVTGATAGAVPLMTGKYLNKPGYVNVPVNYPGYSFSGGLQIFFNNSGVWDGISSTFVAINDIILGDSALPATVGAWNKIRATFTTGAQLRFTHPAGPFVCKLVNNAQLAYSVYYLSFNVSGAMEITITYLGYWNGAAQYEYRVDRV